MDHGKLLKIKEAECGIVQTEFNFKLSYVEIKVTWMLMPYTYSVTYLFIVLLVLLLFLFNHPILNAVQHYSSVTNERIKGDKFVTVQ